MSSKGDTNAKNTSTITPAEISIDVPWGQISGKAWGSPSGKPVLSLHGWLDNAGSFDKLIPLLSPDSRGCFRGGFVALYYVSMVLPNLYMVAIDWPGHGLSSPRPAGSHYHMINYVTDLKYVIDGLGWRRFSFLAHSLGAGVATIFAASLPDYVEKMVAMEGIVPHPIVYDHSELPTRMGNTLKIFEDKAVKVYPSREACVARINNPKYIVSSAYPIPLIGLKNNEKMMEGNLTQESAEILAIRGTAPVENGYVFTRDLRLLPASLLCFSPEMAISFLRAVQCPILLITAEKSAFEKEHIDIILKCLQMSKWVTVPGNHQVHLNNAASVAPFVNEWLTTDVIGLKNML